MTNSCAACTKAIRAAQSLQCSRCASHYHAVCLNVSDIRKMSAEARANYICPLCKSNVPKSDNTPVRAAASASADTQATSACVGGLKAVVSPAPCFSPTPDQDQIALIASEIKLMREDMRDMKLEMKNLSENVASRLDEVSLKYLELEMRDAKREAELCSLKSTVAELQQQLSSRAQSNLKNEIEISGISEIKDENSLHIIRVTAQKIGIDIDGSDLDYAMRVGPRRPGNGELTSGLSKQPRPLVVRFVHRHKREEFLRAAKTRRNLHSADIGIEGQSRKLYFNERLTQENRHLFRSARQGAAEADFKFCWCKNGTIYLRRQEGSPAIAVKSPEDLERILRPPRAPKSQPPLI